MNPLHENPLHEILKDTSDEDFEKSINNIRTLFFPQKEYEVQLEASLKDLNRENDPESRVKQTNEKIDDIVDLVCQEKELTYPFLEHFHKLFLERQWTIPYKDPGAPDSSHHLVRLEPDKESESYYSTEYNYSKNYGDYNHFVNVVAALARLIIYFSHQENIQKIVDKIFEQPESPPKNEQTKEFYQNLGDILIYDKEPSFRTFKLMLAGFYHDIGKSIQYARHAMEGAIILDSHTTYSRYRLNVISQKTYKQNFERNDLFFIADLVLYHDQYGTLSTGEDGYLQLVDIIDRVYRHTSKNSDKLEERLKESSKYIFDLWLLNIADIMVSLEKKRKLQKEWNKHDSAITKIEEFFDGKYRDQANNLIHDLEITLQLLHECCYRVHVDDLSEIKSEAHKISRNHATERLQRLITTTLEKAARDWKEKIEKELKHLLLQRFAPKLWDKINRENIQLSEEEQLSEEDKKVKIAIDKLFELLDKDLWGIENKILKSVQSSQEISSPAAEEAIKIIQETIQKSDNDAINKLTEEVDDNKTNRMDLQKDIKQKDIKTRLEIEILRSIKALRMNKIIEDIQNLQSETWKSIIVGQIKSIGNREEFFQRFSWVKKSDYALGFFQELAQEALEYTKKEVEEQKTAYRTGWLSISEAKHGFDNSKPEFDYFNKAQAQFIADNYAMTVIQILNHLLFRESSINSPRNVEFSDAKKRLTKDKKKQILSLEGPCRSMNSIDLILKTIYIY
ncbi:MAG: HD domain-containing protein [Xenococcaceae cyanobacterium MO_188.B32]|nr:HD domain-containing protein [Xenococcaceae cyanobacterium MO_188.B32]